MSKPKILYFDVETAPQVGILWSIFQNGIQPDDLLEDWYIFCACWQWEGDKTVHSAQITKLGDDKALCKKLREVISSADIIIGHNHERFDLRKVNTRLIMHRLKPIPQIASVDTLKEVRKIAAFSSNRLDYLGKVLTGDGKAETKKGLWKRTLLGDKVALREMVNYCKKDVTKLVEVYKILRPYFKTHPHLGVLQGKDRHESCSKCGSENLAGISKTRVTAAGLVKVQKQCNKCHSYTTFNK